MSKVRMAPDVEALRMVNVPMPETGVRALMLTKPEAELIDRALEYWSDRLAYVACDSPAHKMAGAHVRDLIGRLRDRLAALMEGWQ